MLRRESQLRNAAETQRRLDDLNRQHQQEQWPDFGFDDCEDDHADANADDHSDDKQPETMEEAKEMIATLRAQLQQVQEGTDSLRGASCDKEVFESIKARVVREFDLGPEFVDVLNSAVARFPGDPDIVASANCKCRPLRASLLNRDSYTALDSSTQTSSTTLTLRWICRRPQVQPRGAGKSRGRRHRADG
jgi:hypothetical protein